MNLQVLTISLVCLFCFIVGAELDKRDQTSTELKNIRKTGVLELNDATTEELERKKKELPAALRGLVTVLCASFTVKSLLGGRSVRNDDLPGQLEIRDEKRAVPVIVAVRLLCALNTLNNVRIFCKSIASEKRDILHPENVDGEDQAHQLQKKGIMDRLKDLARPVCRWLHLNGRDVLNVEHLNSGIEYLVDRRDLGETWYF